MLKKQLPLFHILLAAIWLQMIESAIVYCQTNPIVTSDDYPALSEMAPANPSPLANQLPSDQRRQSAKNWAKKLVPSSSPPNPFRHESATSHRPRLTNSPDRAVAFNRQSEVRIQVDVASLPDQLSTAAPEQTMDISLSQPMSVLAAKSAHHSSVTWDFELQLESEDRSRPIAQLATQRIHHMQASTPNKPRIIYLPAVPTMDNHGRYILKPKVMLSSGEVLSGSGAKSARKGWTKNNFPISSSEEGDDEIMRIIE